MLGLVLLFVLMWAALIALFWVGALLLQGLLYSEPEPELYWRAPAVATVLTLMLAGWGKLAYDAPDRFQAWFLLTNTKTTEVTKLQARVRDDPKNWRVYTAHRNARGLIEYWADDTGRHMPTPPEAVKIREGDEEVEFVPDRDPKTNTFKRDLDHKVVYHDERGRTMTEDRLGTVTESHSGVLVLNWFLTVLIFAVCFVCLWLLLRFQWPHALGLAAVCWLVITLFIQPMLHARIDEARRQTVSSQAT
ncbi:MAG TPA: hypothetical protein VFA18_08470 [Gemmataceae bacterium]|nr:hypothetical protein [Gemmataceae bacterium]